MSKHFKGKASILGSIILLVATFFVLNGMVLAQSVSSAKLSLLPAEEEALLPGATVNVSVLFESGGHQVDAVDVVILYDANKVDIQNVQGTNLFASYPLESAQDGTIRISGLSNINEPISSNGTFATFDVHMKDNVSGSTSLAVVYGDDAGSHVAEHGTAIDVLGETVGATYSIGANSPTVTPTPIVDALPSTGIIWPTYMLIFFVLVSSMLGFAIVR